MNNSDKITLTLTEDEADLIFRCLIFMELGDSEEDEVERRIKDSAIKSIANQTGWEVFDGSI